MLSDALGEGEVACVCVAMFEVANVTLALVVTLLLGLPGELLALGDMDGVGDTEGEIDGDTDIVPLASELELLHDDVHTLEALKQ